jgi:SAM-dependent methyltransferase
MYVCPQTQEKLYEVENGLASHDGVFYPFFRGKNNIPIPNFLAPARLGEVGQQSLDMYNQKVSPGIYRNFLDWLFLTFNENELTFRQKLIEKLKLQRGAKVLVTGCGLGDDILPIAAAVGSDGEIYAQDIAAEMVIAASDSIMPDPQYSKNIHLSVCDAQNLPFADNFFDAAFHFGGINLFDDIRLAIREMDRVVKPGGRVCFGDEGIGPWLRDTEYGRMAITNNPLWAATAPIDALPRNAIDVELSWVLGNCFYVIGFQVSENGPLINIDVSHKGRRGGTMRTRFYGQLEGVTEDSKNFVINEAAEKGISIHDWLEQVIQERRGKSIK